MIISFWYHIPAPHGSQSWFRFTFDLLAASFAESKVPGEKLPNTAQMCESPYSNQQWTGKNWIHSLLMTSFTLQIKTLPCSTLPTWSKRTGDVKRAHRADQWSLHEDLEMASQRSSDFPRAISPCFTEITQST